MPSRDASLPYGGLLPDRPATWPRTLTAEEFVTRFPCESDTVEFKQGVSAVPDSAVAFSNSRGGIILIGVTNAGEISGAKLTPAVEDKIREGLEQAYSIAPVAIRSLEVDGRHVTVLGVGQLREGIAQTSSGRVLVRVGTRRPPLIGPDLVRFMHERSASTFESVATAVPFDDASPPLLSTLASVLGVAEDDRLPDRFEERGFLTTVDGRRMLTVAGALYLLDRPDRHLGKAYIEVRRFRAGAAEPDRREQVDGPLQDQVLNAKGRVLMFAGEDVVVIGVRRHELPRLPEPVVREAIANAVAHRSYEQRGTPVRIDLHPDRVEITSPGSLVPPVTLETMRNAHAARNTNVIKALRAFGLAEDSGRGVDVMEDVMRDELLDSPTFEADASSVRVTLPVLSGTRPEERAWLREVVTRGQIEDRDRVLLVHARRGEVLSNARARELLGMSRESTTRALQRLVGAGMLERSGNRGGTRYQLARELGPPAGLRLGRSELLALIAEMAKTGPVTNAAVRARTGLERQEVLGLLEQLVQDGELIRIGERRGTRYVRAENLTPGLGPGSTVRADLTGAPGVTGECVTPATVIRRGRRPGAFIVQTDAQFAGTDVFELDGSKLALPPPESAPSQARE
jgi:ATP-dependent DNA helicase RecG